MNPLLKRAQVAHILADSGAALMVGTGSRLASLEAGDVPAACRTVAEDAGAQARAQGGEAGGDAGRDALRDGARAEVVR